MLGIKKGVDEVMELMDNGLDPGLAVHVMAVTSGKLMCLSSGSSGRHLSALADQAGPLPPLMGKAIDIS